MTTILRLDASARKARSLTRSLSTSFINHWLEADPTVRIIERDVGTNPPSFITEDWIAAVFADPADLTPDQQALVAESDELIEEVERADIIVIASPMYNYGMPAHLKAWVDQVVRINRTFTFDLARGDQPLRPILSGKTLVSLTSWGEFGFGRGEANEHANHLTTHLQTVSKYLGVDDIHHIGIEYQEFGDERFAASKAKASADLQMIVSRLASRAADQSAA
ncbi:NAD(P)H-dependent oxidoreductase [Pyruvatibacter sp. HU-CL02332]|uniref:FMN-dependent NADH-azoreductase n=1 Tax=Pyruvatibacter sp. HU-CL02332 TaxID=3127650 RepID=UPI0031084297